MIDRYERLYNLINNKIVCILKKKLKYKYCISDCNKFYYVNNFLNNFKRFFELKKEKNVFIVVKK